jgi:hypothetical protein
VYPALDLVEFFCEVADGKGFAEASALFVPLFVAFTSGVPVGVGLIGERVGGQLVRRDVLKVLVRDRP